MDSSVGISDLNTHARTRMHVHTVALTLGTHGADMSFDTSECQFRSLNHACFLTALAPEGPEARRSLGSNQWVCGCVGQ